MTVTYPDALTLMGIVISNGPRAAQARNARVSVRSGMTRDEHLAQCRRAAAEQLLERRVHGAEVPNAHGGKHHQSIRRRTT